MKTSVKAYKAMLDIPPYHTSRNMNRASTSEITPIVKLKRRMSKQLSAEQSKLWER